MLCLGAWCMLEQQLTLLMLQTPAIEHMSKTGDTWVGCCWGSFACFGRLVLLSIENCGIRTNTPVWRRLHGLAPLLVAAWHLILQVSILNRRLSDSKSWHSKPKRLNGGCNSINGYSNPERALWLLIVVGRSGVPRAGSSRS